jgi:hypothetical protein
MFNADDSGAFLSDTEYNVSTGKLRSRRGGGGAYSDIRLK